MKAMARAFIICLAMFASTDAGANDLQTELRNELRSLPGERPASIWTLIPMVGIAAHDGERINLKPTDNTTIANSEATAPIGGLLLEIGRGIITLQTGAYYLRQGFQRLTKVTESDGITTRTVGVAVSYLGIPLFAKLNLRTRAATYYLKAGVIQVRKVDVESTPELRVEGTRATTDLPAGDSPWSEKSIRPENTIATAGGGISFKLRPTFALQLEGTFNRTLRSINVSENNDKGDEFKARSLAILFGVAFSL